jgi:hypothetical protein
LIASYHAAPVWTEKEKPRKADAARAQAKDFPRRSGAQAHLLYSEGAGTPEQTAAHVHAQLEVWGAIVREIGLQPE